MTFLVSVMPEETAGLVHMSLDLMQVEAFLVNVSTIGFWVDFEEGRCLFTVQAVKRRGLLKSTPMLKVAALAVDRPIVAQTLLEIHMQAPRHAHDLKFMAQLAVEIKSTAWAVAATEGMGESTTFPGRPKSC